MSIDAAQAAGTQLSAPAAVSSASQNAGMRALVVVAISLGAHLSAALALAMLPEPARLVPERVEVTVVIESLVEDRAEDRVAERVEPAAALPPPEPVAPEPVAPPPELPARRPVVARARPAAPAPEPAVEEPAPEPARPAPAEPSPALAAGGGPSLLAAAGGEPSYGGGTGGGTGSGRGEGAGVGAGAARPDVAPPGPSAGDLRRARQGYVRALGELLRAEARYPRAARREGLQGRVELALRVGRDGRLLDVRVVRSSGYPELDDAAIEAARRITPPAPPEMLAWALAEEVRAPVVYVLQ